MSKGFVYRFFIYGVVVLYILMDLNLFKGPLHSWVLTKRGMSHTELRQHGIAAMVYGQPILDTQVEYRQQEYLYQRGQKLEDLSSRHRIALFKHCLEDLIKEHLLRIKTHHNALDLPAPPADTLSKEIHYDELQFNDRYEREDALRRQGYMPEELALRAEAHLQQRQYLAHQIHTEVTDEERAHFRHTEVTVPELVKVRHIFRTTFQKEAEQVKAEFTAALAPLLAGDTNFKALSTVLNEDERAKAAGGELGWLAYQRLPPPLEHLLPDMPIGKAQLLKSSLGWHYLEVTARKPASVQHRSPEELTAHLENYKRKEGLELYLKHLRIREADHVDVIWSEGDLTSTQ